MSVEGVVDSERGSSGVSTAQPDKQRDDPLQPSASKIREALERHWHSMAGVINTAHKTGWFVRGDETLEWRRGAKVNDYKPARRAKRSGTVGSGRARVPRLQKAAPQIPRRRSPNGATTDAAGGVDETRTGERVRQ